MQKIYFKKMVDLNHQLHELISISVDESIRYKMETNGMRAVGSIMINGEYKDTQEKHQFHETIDLDIFALFEKITDKRDFHVKVEDFDYHLVDGNLSLVIQAYVYGVLDDEDRVVDTVTRNEEVDPAEEIEELLREEEKIVDEPLRKNYQKLRRRNIELLESMDAVHCNSTNTLQVYKGRGYSGCNAQVISISNGAISDHKKVRKVGTPLRFGYLGPLTTHKGYNLFRNACDALWQSGQHCFEAHIFVETANLPSYMICHKPYSYNELSNVMDTFDVLVTPSECEETFGFTVLEALSYGIPVIVSKKVGAKDLIVEGRNGFIVDGPVQALETCFKKLAENPATVQNMNLYIVKNFDVKTMIAHSSEIETVYREICSKL